MEGRESRGRKVNQKRMEVVEMYRSEGSGGYRLEDLR